MKKQILFLIGLIAANVLLAQVPQGISHQAVIRDANNELVANSTIGIQVSILQGSAEGEAVYVETHTPMSNSNGLITYVIGEGAVESGVFAEIDWSAGPYFLKTEADPMGGTDYTITGITQFHSVPYAHFSDMAAYSKTAGTLKDGDNIGEWLFWNGEQWVAVESGQYGQTLSWCNGIPTWGPCPPSVPVVTTGAVTGITENTATGSGTVVNQGSAFVSTRGLVWGTDPNPTLQDNDGSASSGSGTGSFSLQMTGLSSATTYYVRAYATNNQGTAYGNQVNFTTDAPTTFPPTLSTNPITEITQTTATSGGNITDDGGAEVTARGVVWHTSSNPTLENHLGQTNDGGGTGSYVSEIIELQPNTGYYVRAYAVNSQGVSYGNQRVFVTQQDGDLPTVITIEATDITLTSATTGGEVTDDGGNPVLARGVCWSTQENPTLFDSYIEAGAGLGVFTSELTGLVVGTTYYVRSFATSSQGIAYGNQVSFTTDAGLAEVSIVSLNSGQPGLRVIDGEVSDDGGAEVTARGFVWDTMEDPTLEQNEGFSADGAGLGEFTVYFDDLTPGVIYYIKAYATSGVGTSYSEQKFFNFWDYHATVTDFDGNVYQTVLIGNQEWMAENLRTSSYSTGIPIPTGLSNAEWGSTTEGAYAIYNNNNDMLEAYGKLYNWYAVDDARGLCPEGWSVPSDVDWTQLVDYVVAQGYPNEQINPNGAGNALKSCRQQNSPYGGECNTSTHPRWNSHSTHSGFDEFGFSALPGGVRFSSGHFSNVGGLGSWWSATELSGTYAWLRRMHSDRGNVARDNNFKTSGFSIRCFRDIVRTEDE